MKILLRRLGKGHKKDVGVNTTYPTVKAFALPIIRDKQHDSPRQEIL